MSNIFPHRFLLLGLLLIGLVCQAGCTPGSPSRDTGGQAFASTSSPGLAEASPGVPRRLLVLRLGSSGLEVLRSEPLGPGSPRAARRRPAGWDGRYRVLDGRGEVLAAGAFRIPRRVHALFGEVDGPAEPASVPQDELVLWLRLDVPRGSAGVELWDSAQGVLLGTVPL